MDDIYNQFRDFKSFEVVFIDGNGNPQKIFCTVRSIGNDNIEIDANNEKNRNIFADIGTELKLHIYTENGIYTATSKVMMIERGLVNTSYIIAYPANSKHSQRREYFRAEMAIDFIMTVSADKNTGEKFVVEARTQNICGKGMSFISDREFSKDDSIEIQLKFSERIVTTNSSLVYSKQVNFAGRTKFVSAFSFNDISSKDIDFIVKKCFLHQLELRKKHNV